LDEVEDEYVDEDVWMTMRNMRMKMRMRVCE
jgi:hypothetical protein